MGNRTYWEEQAIKKIARELEMEHFNSQVEHIKKGVDLGHFEKDALNDFYLSEKPFKSIIIHDPGHIMSRRYIEKDDKKD